MLRPSLLLRIFFLMLLFSLGCVSALTAAPKKLPPVHKEYLQNKDYQEYLQFFKDVYKTMMENYYHPLDETNLEKFLYLFNVQLYPQYKSQGSSANYIKWRSAAYLVEALRAKDDIFSAFFPPKDAVRYETEALGKKVDLGIEGELAEKGFLVKWVEPRSDAFEKGLREKDLIVRIDGQETKGLTEKKIKELLMPLEGAKVILEYLEKAQNIRKKIEVVSREYFKQQVFLKPVDVPGIYCLQLQHFNQKTSEDVGRLLAQILADKNLKGLIIDLRGNPGGPPLAAQEISGFFLPPNTEFAFFQKKNRPKALLMVPDLPPETRYTGNIVILVDHKSGSASELFSGILQNRHRAVVMGVNTAGQVFLKSMFYFSDNSMVLLVTARGHHPDGSVFSYDGVDPDQKVEDKSIDLIKYAADYLVEKYNTDPM